MNFRLVRVFAVGAIAIGAATMAHAQQSGPQHKISIGESMNTRRTALRAME